MKPFRWPRNRPQNEVDFQKLMLDIDAHLHEAGFEPMQRPHVFPLRFGEAFGDVNLVYPNDTLAESAGYDGDILVAKGHRWYQDIYGNRLIANHKIASAPVRLGNALWHVQIPQVYGTCRYFMDRNLANLGKNGDGSPLQRTSLIMGMERLAELNILTLVEDLPQGMATRLTAEQLLEFSEWFHTTVVGLSWFVNLFWRVQYRDNDLFATAFRDYGASTDSLLNGRYAQSRWDSAQAIEKIIKGLRHIAGIDKQTEEEKNERAWSKHQLSSIAKPLQDEFKIKINSQWLQEAQCEPNMRYGTMVTSREDCLRANHAVSKIAKELSENQRVNQLLEGGRIL